MVQLKSLISKPHKLAYVWVPKCASSTMFQVFQVLSDVPEDEMRRRVEVTDDMLSEYGSQRIQVRHNEIKAFIESTDYSWFTIVRDPYGRLVSNYNNKIDRFAEKLAPEIFKKYEKRIAIARKHHVDIPAIRRKMQREISLSDFVDGLVEFGTKFDTHFIPQTTHINYDKVSYDAVLKMESLDEDLPNFLEEVLVPSQVIDRIMDVQPRNKTKRSKVAPAELTPALREKIYALYFDDFKLLGYPH